VGVYNNSEYVQLPEPPTPAATQPVAPAAKDHERNRGSTS